MSLAERIKYIYRKQGDYFKGYPIIGVMSYKK